MLNQYLSNYANNCATEVNIEIQLITYANGVIETINNKNIITPSAAARRRQISHKMMVPVLPTPALQWTTTDPIPGGVANNFFKYVTMECVYNGTLWSGQAV